MKQQARKAERETAFSAAFEAAGYRAPQDRLDAIGRAALAESPRSLELARAHVLRGVAGDGELLWALFERWQRPAVDLLLSRLAAELREERAKRSAEQAGANATSDPRGLTPQRAGGATAGPASAPPRGPSAAERAAAKAAVVQHISKLDTFIINGRRLGDCTPEEAYGWANSRARDVRFVQLLTANLPPGVPIRHYISPERAEAVYLQAQKELANE